MEVLRGRLALEHWIDVRLKIEEQGLNRVVFLVKGVEMVSLRLLVHSS